MARPKGLDESVERGSVMSTLGPDGLVDVGGVVGGVGVGGVGVGGGDAAALRASGNARSINVVIAGSVIILGSIGSYCPNPNELSLLVSGVYSIRAPPPILPLDIIPRGSVKHALAIPASVMLVGLKPAYPIIGN